MKITCFDCLL